MADKDEPAGLPTAAASRKRSREGSSSKISIPDSHKEQRLTKTKKVNPAVLAVRRSIQRCCATDDLPAALQLYDSAIARAIPLEAQTFYCLLNLCDGLSDRGVHVGTPKQKTQTEQRPEDAGKDSALSCPSNLQPSQKAMSADERMREAFRIRKHMDEISLPLNETAYTALVRILAKAGNTKAAEETVAEAERCQQCKPKLRMYSPLLLAHCKGGDMIRAVEVWDRIHKINSERYVDRGAANSDESITLSEREYCALMRCAVRTGCVVIFERILAEIAEEVLVPSRDTVDAITSWFESAHSTSTEAFQGEEEAGASDPMASLLPPTTQELPSMGSCLCTAPAKWELSRVCSIDTSTGKLTSGCLAGKKLKPVGLSFKTWSIMMDMNESIVMQGSIEGDKSKFQGGGKGPKRFLKMKETVERRREHWSNFKKFLVERIGPIGSGAGASVPSCRKGGRKFDVIIDGANIGYFKQNFTQAPKHVDYRQIDWVIEHFRERGQSVLLFLHERHFSRNLMPSWAEPIVQSWEEKGVLYRTPAGSNDDWFWLHAALWCGQGTLVLTNDEMRDHHFQMLGHRYFLRWKERSQVHFTFRDWHTHKGGEKRRELELTFPEIYSRRIQRLDDDSLAIPLAKEGDTNRFLDGAHEADDNYPVEETYMCIRRTH